MITTTTPPDLPVDIAPWKSEHCESHPPLPGLPRSQWIYRFPNEWGASVIQSPTSYGGGEGLYELALVGFGTRLDEWGVMTEFEVFACGADHPIGDDVHGWLSIPEVTDLLARIAAMPPRVVMKGAS